MIAKHLPMIDQAGEKGVKILCLQEIFFGPYFPAEQDAKWYALAETIPGPTTELMQERARRHGMVMIVPIYEREMSGVYYNSAVVIDADGTILGKYRKNHIPQLQCFWEKFYFKPGNLGYPVFATRYATIGVYICYDRHFPEGARLLGLAGAEIVFNPSATIAGLSKYLWELEQPAHAVANGYWICAINRVGTEEPWKSGQFYGSSYVCDPRGQIVAQASDSNDELLIHDVDLDLIRVVRDTWQFFRDRRPETYTELASLLP
jgi:N-carbamoylputrescine amidase